MFKQISQVLGGLAVLISLLLVAYELKRNNDIRVVESQYELLSLQTELRSMLADPNVLRVVMTRDYKSLSEEERILFMSTIMGWFDLFELVFLAAEQDVLSEEQFRAWNVAACNLPDHWLAAFSETIGPDTYMESVVNRLNECVDGRQ